MDLLQIDKVTDSMKLLSAACEENPEATIRWIANRLLEYMSCQENYEPNPADIVATILIQDLALHFGVDAKAKDILDEGRAWLARRN